MQINSISNLVLVVIGETVLLVLLRSYTDYVVLLVPCGSALKTMLTICSSIRTYIYIITDFKASRPDYLLLKTPNHFKAGQIKFATHHIIESKSLSLAIASTGSLTKLVCIYMATYIP